MHKEVQNNILLMSETYNNIIYMYIINGLQSV